MRLPKISRGWSNEPGQLQSSSGFTSGGFSPPPSPGIFAMWKLKSNTGHPFPWNIWDGWMDLPFRGWIGAFPSRKNRGKSPKLPPTAPRSVPPWRAWDCWDVQSGMGKVGKNLKIGLGWNSTERVALLLWIYIYIYNFFLLTPCIIYLIYTSPIHSIYIIFQYISMHVTDYMHQSSGNLNLPCLIYLFPHLPTFLEGIGEQIQGWEVFHG